MGGTLSIVSCIDRILNKFYVGELLDNEMPVFPERR